MKNIALIIALCTTITTATATAVIDSITATAEHITTTAIICTEEQTETATEEQTQDTTATQTQTETEDTTTATEDTTAVVCDKCGQHFTTENEYFEHDITAHGYCEEHGRYSDCYTEDGTLKDYYHRF
jgi:hypothetical protein